MPLRELTIEFSSVSEQVLVAAADACTRLVVFCFHGLHLESFTFFSVCEELDAVLRALGRAARAYKGQSWIMTVRSATRGWWRWLAAVAG